MKKINQFGLLGVVAAALLLTGIVLPPTQAGAQIGDFGQFHSGYRNARKFFVGNPTGREMYSLMIVYGFDGSLDKSMNETSGAADDRGCQGEVIPAHGANDNADDTPFGDGYDQGDSTRQPFEMISVPTDNGEYDRLGREGIGVVVRANRSGVRAIRPSFFRLPTGSDRADLVACICAELSDDSQSDTLFSALGVNCAPRGGERSSARLSTKTP